MSLGPFAAEVSLIAHHPRCDKEPRRAGWPSHTPNAPTFPSSTACIRWGCARSNGLEAPPHLFPLLYHLPPSLLQLLTMPTPESELFKAKKPTVPPTFEGVDFTNNKQVWDARDAIVREQWVKQMMARLVREELGR
jgi:hypothetical protein